MTFQCSSKCILLYLVEAENLSYLVCLCYHQLIVSAYMAYGKACCDRLVMSAIGRGVESGGTAVCLPFLDPDMLSPSNTGVPGKKRVSRRRHDMSDSIIHIHQVSTSTQETWHGNTLLEGISLPSVDILEYVTPSRGEYGQARPLTPFQSPDIAHCHRNIILLNQHILLPWNKKTFS